MGQITRYLVDFNRLPLYALSINTKRKGETVDDLLNTKFCISTGHWITYECLLDTGTVVHLRKPTIVGEEDTITLLKYVWRVGLSDKYGYDAMLKNRVLDADIRGAAEYRKWADDYILGFFEGVAGNHDTEHLSRFSKHPRILGILDGFDSMKRYERLEAK